MITKAGFVALVGRPNAGKSTLLNTLAHEHLAMVSHKANATRKRLNCIVLHQNAQIIFTDTPGIHQQEKLLNQFMLNEALKALGDCDLSVFIAPATDNVQHYKDFLSLCNHRRHILLLSKIDTITQADLLVKITEYQAYSHLYEALIPYSATKKIGITSLLTEIIKYLPESPPLYDEEIITTENFRELYKEMIREAIFEYMSDEIPYESDVQILAFKESPLLDRVKAVIVVDKESQKGLMIGKKGENIKRIGRKSRELMEALSEKKVFLELSVKVKKGWSKKKEFLAQFGYNFE